MSRSSGLVIPVFLPLAGCGHRCIYCNQAALHPQSPGFPSAAEIAGTVNKYIGFSAKTPRELAFYGGNFCGIPVEEKERLLGIAAGLREASLIDSIRLSTRPDSISAPEADYLRDRNVRMVELGVQSFDDGVLAASHRGHTAAEAVEAVAVLKSRGISVGLHLMLGLPGADEVGDLESARMAAALGPETVRIHPTLVLKGAPLEKEYAAGRYRPLSLEEAASRCAAAMGIFETAGVRVIRVGVHGDDELLSGRALVAGPFHPSLRTLAERLRGPGHHL